MKSLPALRLAFVGVAVALFAACAVEQPSYQSQVAPYEAPGVPASRGRVVAPVAANTGVVSSIEPMRGEASRMSPAGAILGAVVGGLVGNQIGAGTGKAVATGAGVVGGALAGNAVGNRVSSTADTYRIGIQYDGGGSQFIDVPNPGDLRIGDRVRVDGNQISR